MFHHHCDETLRRELKNTTRSGVFLTNFEVFPLVMNHCVECFILLLKQNDFERKMYLNSPCLICFLPFLVSVFTTDVYILYLGIVFQNTVKGMRTCSCFFHQYKCHHSNRDCWNIHQTLRHKNKRPDYERRR